MNNEKFQGSTAPIGQTEPTEPTELEKTEVSDIDDQGTDHENPYRDFYKGIINFLCSEGLSQDERNEKFKKIAVELGLRYKFDSMFDASPAIQQKEILDNAKVEVKEAVKKYVVHILEKKGVIFVGKKITIDNKEYEITAIRKGGISIKEEGTDRSNSGYNVLIVLKDYLDQI
jgi:hypothetical protein